MGLDKRLEHSGVGTTGPVAHHSDQDELAFPTLVDLYRVAQYVITVGESSPFSATVRGPPLSPWQVSVP